jgi:hypothetical protein
MLAAMTRSAREVKAVDQALAQHMRLHHGLIRRNEALRLGASEGMIVRRLEHEIWSSVYPGVYRSAAAPRTDHQRLLAAVWGAGEGALASHRSAAWLWGLADKRLGALEVVVPNPRVVNLGGVTAHRSIDAATMTPVERGSIPVTDPFRTLIDLGAVAHWREVENAVDRAIASRLVTVAGVRAALTRIARPGVRGAGVLRRLLEARGVQSPRYAPSVLESRMARLLKALALPPPIVELVTGSRGQYRLDFAFPAVMFVVEVNGYCAHSALASPDADLTRANQLQREGWAHLVYTWHHVTRMRAYIAAEILDTYRRQSSLCSLVALDAG